MKDNKNSGRSSKVVFLRTVIITTICIVVAVIGFWAVGFLTGRIG